MDLVGVIFFFYSSVYEEDVLNQLCNAMKSEFEVNIEC